MTEAGVTVGERRLKAEEEDTKAGCVKEWWYVAYSCWDTRFLAIWCHPTIVADVWQGNLIDTLTPDTYLCLLWSVMVSVIRGVTQCSVLAIQQVENIFTSFKLYYLWKRFENNMVGFIQCSSWLKRSTFLQKASTVGKREISSLYRNRNHLVCSLQKGWEHFYHYFFTVLEKLQKWLLCFSLGVQ